MCTNCMKQLKDVLSSEQLAQFENAFYSVVNGYILKRKESTNGNEKSVQTGKERT